MTTVPKRPTDRRPAPPARRAGYAVAVAVNLVILYLINVRPGWEAVPFLTADTATLLAVVNLSVVVGVAVNLLYLVYDARWFVALGGLATTGVGLLALARIWQVFPVTFAADSNWPLVLRVALLFAIAASIVALIVQVVQIVAGLARAGLVRDGSPAGPRR